MIQLLDFCSQSLKRETRSFGHGPMSLVGECLILRAGGPYRLSFLGQSQDRDDHDNLDDGGDGGKDVGDRQDERRRCSSTPAHPPTQINKLQHDLVIVIMIDDLIIYHIFHISYHIYHDGDARITSRCITL